MEIGNTCKFKCGIDGCSASLEKLCSLESSGERTFICDVPNCQKSYKNVWHLKRHVGQVHEKEDEVTCDFEGCGMTLSSRYNLKKHKIRSHIETNTPFSCSVCPQKFRKRWQLNQHLFSHTGKPAFTCIICNMGFDQLHLYNKHKRGHKTFTCDCGAEFGKWTIFCEHRRNSCTIKKIDHKCIVCNKVFTTKMNLTQHSLKVHLEESQNHFHQCPYSGCKRGYKYKKNLTAHISTIHEKVKEELPVECTESGCGKMFKCQRYLKRHVAHIHQGAKKANIEKARRPRKDKGKPRKPIKSMASILSGIKLSAKENLDIINKHANSATSSSAQIKLESGIKYDSKDMSEAKEEDKLSEPMLTRQKKNYGSSQVVASDRLDSEDNLLQLCNEMTRKIQECLEHTPLQAKQDSLACCEIQA